MDAIVFQPHEITVSYDSKRDIVVLNVSGNIIELHARSADKLIERLTALRDGTD
jgi:hypothetical protein